MRPFLLFSLLAIPSLALAQGSLTPPGAPTPTMKSLDQIEARTPLAAGVAPITISAGGSYYLTGNLTVASGDAIAITAAGVTLDLGGFTVSSTANPAAGTAVKITARRVTVRNGVVSGAGTVSGATFSGAGFANGVLWFGSIPQSIVVSDVLVTGCSTTGIKASLVERCILQNIGVTGISGTMVRGCQVDPCGGTAIYAIVASDCVGSGYAGGISGGNLSNCMGTLNGNSGSGIACSVAQNCAGSAFGTGGTGLTCTSAQNSVGTTYGANGVGVSCVTAVGCQGTAGAGSNGGAGLAASGAAVGCQGTADNGLGLYGDAATACQGNSTSGEGLRGTALADCAATSTNGIDGMDGKSIANCYATTGGTGSGSFAISGFTVLNSGGIARDGNGIIAAAVMNCDGQSSADSGGYGVLGFGTVTSCVGAGGYAPNPGTGIFGYISIGSEALRGSMNASYRYNQPQ